MLKNITQSKWTALSLLAVLLLVGGLTVVTIGHEDHDHSKHHKVDSPPMDPAMMMWLEMASPNEHHAKLGAFVGKWDVVAKFWMSPEAPPTISKGSSEVKWILDGRFLQENYRSSILIGGHTNAFKGLGLLGYDNAKKQYVGIWADTMSTSVTVMTGQFDKAGKTFTQSGQMADPMTGQLVAMRGVSHLVSDNECFFEMYNTGPDGKEFKRMEIVYTRQ